jgi:uncharacterized protein YydD (DUF2326 family)
MFLKSLTIQNRNTIIREINFHKGLNFIVDETPETKIQQTGNNVGKTTVLRLVDYCLGSSGKSIYKDTEFQKQSKTIIESFLKNKNNNVLISIILSEDLEKEDAMEIEISRNFLPYNKKIQKITDTNIPNDKEFDLELKKYIFNSDAEKPTFRQIISKNIRDEKDKKEKIVKTLGSFGKSEEYEALYLFWLGIEFSNLDEKQHLLEIKKLEERLQKHLAKTSNLPLIEQALADTNAKIEELNNKKGTFNINDKYSEELDALNYTKYELNKLSSELGSLEMRKDLIIQSKDDLEKEVSQVDVSQIKMLYEKAKSLVQTVQVSFEDTLKFHNDLISEKLKYIIKELPDLQKTISKINSKIYTLRIQEKELTEKLRKKGVVDELEEIVKELNAQYERKGKLEQQKSMWEESNKQLQFVTNDLKAINDGIDTKDYLIKSRITEFNKYFTAMSVKLYGESYYLYSEKNTNGYELNTDNIEGNPSTGKKKGQISAFDFAYIQFADSLGIKCLHFIMHDQLENIHDNQLNTVFEVANTNNCQYIVPILRDKIPSNVNINAFEVLSLSQDVKLFKI